MFDIDNGVSIKTLHCLAAAGYKLLRRNASRTLNTLFNKKKTFPQVPRLADRCFPLETLNLTQAGLLHEKEKKKTH
jgi:hypothetical protein